MSISISFQICFMSISISFQICFYVNFYLLPDMFICQLLSPSRYVSMSISISFYNSRAKLQKLFQ